MFLVNYVCVPDMTEYGNVCIEQGCLQKKTLCWNKIIFDTCEAGHQIVNIGPRILRTETATLVAISVCQGLWSGFF